MERTSSVSSLRGVALAMGVLVAAGLASERHALAQERAVRPAGAPAGAHCVAGAGTSPALASVDAETRLRFIEHALRRDANSARVWSWGWGLGFGAIGAANFTLAAVVDDIEPRRSFLVAGSAAMLTPLSIVIAPHRVMGASGELDTLLASGDRGCSTLESAERLFRESADDEAFKSGILAHAAVLAVNTGVLLILGLGFDQWVDGAINAGAGLVLGNALVLTAPTALEKDWKRYEKGDVGQGSVPERAAAFSWSVRPLGISAPLGGARSAPPTLGAALVGTF